MSAVSVDDARLSDLSLGGWFGVALVVGGLGGAGYELVQWATVGSDPAGGLLFGTFLAIVGAALAHDNATPEQEGNCENCGAHVRTHSSRDSADEVVIVQASGRPRRASVGPLSIVLQRQQPEYLYCSGACTEEDTRVVISGDDYETPTTAEVSGRVE